jgi:hypothetical protein
MDEMPLVGNIHSSQHNEVSYQVSHKVIVHALRSSRHPPLATH